MSTESDRYSMIEADDLTGSEQALYLFRLFMLVLTAPLLWYTYFKAKRRTGLKNPRAFVQMLNLRLGHESRKYQFDPLRPRKTAKIIKQLR